MPTNISYATQITGAPSLETLVLHILPHQTAHGDGIINVNGLTAALNAKGTTEVIDGGLEPWAGIMYAESSNAKWQGRDEEMNATTQDPNRRLRWQWAIFTNSIVLNKLDKAMNKGRANIKPLLESLRRQATSTNENQFNSGLWKASPASTEINSIPSFISTTPTTGSIGGLTRSGGAYLQNGTYTTSVTDLGSEAGIGALMEAQSLNQIGTSVADIVVASVPRWSSLASFLTANMRYRPSDKLAQLKIPSINLGFADVVSENTSVLGGANTINVSRVYLINSKFMWIKVLKDMAGNWEVNWERVNKSLNMALYYTWAGQLVTNLPRAHVVMTSVTG